MEYKKGIDRKQYMLLPNRIEDYVGEDTIPVLIDEYVESLEMKVLGFEKVEVSKTGRPPYNPKDMLKLYIYGLMNNIRTSRKLERETGRNVEVIWLMRGLKPDHKSISDFRKNNIEGIKNVSKGFIMLCNKAGVIEGELVAIDGTKVKASNAKDKNYTENKLKIMEERAEKKVKEYEKAIKEAEKAEGKEEEVKKIGEKIKEVRERQERYKKIKEKIEKSGEKQLSLTDKDSRNMKTKDGQMVAYNCQAIVDSKNKIIVGFDVTTEGSDRNQLENMTRKAKEVIKKEKMEIVADTGYSNGEEIKKIEEEGITAYITTPKPDEEKRGECKYTKDKFKYNKEKDVYICPEGEELEYRHKKTEHGKIFGVYKSKKCIECKMREKCTTSKEGRSIHRWEHEEVMERMEERVKKNPDKLRKRKAIVEHVFGCIKSAYNQGYFLLRGKRKVSCEFAMSVLTHNMKRCISLLGIRRMRELI